MPLYVSAATVTDATITTTDVTTNNVTTSKHGWAPKGDGVSTHFLAGDLSWGTPAGTGAVASDPIWDAKGDLAGGTGADTAAKLTVGANGYVLAADSSQSTGLIWRAPSLLAVVYNITGGNKTTTSATMADVDATNSIIAFTAPASGDILVRVSAAVNISNANQNAYFGLRESSTDLVNASGTPKGTFACQGNTTFNGELQVQWTAYLTGVSAGSHTYKLSFGVNGGASFIVRQSAGSPVTLEVWACP